MVLLRLSVPRLSLRVLAHFGTFRRRMWQRFTRCRNARQGNGAGMRRLRCPRLTTPQP
jgi:hypothetical protein